MLQLPVGREAGLGESTPQYERHRPERTLLYQLIEEHYPTFEAQWAAEGRVLPDYVRRKFEEYLKSISRIKALFPATNSHPGWFSFYVLKEQPRLYKGLLI